MESVELKPEHWETLDRVLQLLEGADTAQDAVWFGAEDRAELQQIHEQIKEQT